MTNERTAPADWPRHDLSAVPALGAHPARRCPVRAQWDVLEPAEPDEVPEALGSHPVALRELEVSVFEALRAQGKDVAFAGNHLSLEEREQRTVDAMASGARVIVDGQPPIDITGHRKAHPDILVRVGTEPSDGRWRYVPIDVAAHKTTPVGHATTPIVLQSLDDLGRVAIADQVDFPGRHDGDTRQELLKLAHYWRALEACDHAPDGPAWAGILGREMQVAWYRLDNPMWTASGLPPIDEDPVRTTLDTYDHEFAFRLDVIAAAMAHKSDPSTALLVAPELIDECPACPWRTHCGSLFQ